MSLRFVLDTNVVISALIWRGIPAEPLTAAAQGKIILCTSQALIQELTEKLASPKLEKAMQARGIRAELLITSYLALCEMTSCSELLQPVCRDPDDDWVLATALAANTNIIVSGDQDLLVLHPYSGIEILNPADAMQRSSSQSEAL